MFAGKWHGYVAIFAETGGDPTDTVEVRACKHAAARPGSGPPLVPRQHPAQDLRQSTADPSPLPPHFQQLKTTFRF
jgi:hypothetical protein